MDLRETQEALEQQWLDIGVSKYKGTYSETAFSYTDIGNYILCKAMTAMEDYVRTFAKSTTFNSNVQKGIFLCLTPTEISVIVLKCLMDAAFSGRAHFKKSESLNCISSLSIKLGHLLLDHFNYVVLKKKSPKAYAHMVESLENKNKRYYYRTIRWYKDTLKHTDLRGTTSELTSVGYPMLKGAIETSGLFEVHPETIGTKTMNLLYPTEKVMRYVLSSIEKMASMHPMYMPMVCPPKPWTTIDDGGYLTLRSLAITHQESTAIQLEAEGALGSRLEILNKQGAVPWEINQEILRHLKHAYETNHKSVPLNDVDIVIPEKPWKSYVEYKTLEATRPDVVHEWKQQAAIAYGTFYHSRTVGQRLAFLRTMSIAKKFAQYEAIWFPYRLDYRGRVYSIATSLNPQGNDVARSLLRFHQRTPLSPKDSEAWRWYMIQGSNLMGNDKVSFDDRVSFIRVNHNRILQCAVDPFEYQWWTDADKPWCFLAWCIEYTSIVLGKQDYTQLPVNRDGRCNGLQHLATTVRDRGTAELVSLVPMSKPSDIYTKVLERVESVIPEDSYWKGKVTRKLVKRNTMTTPYNVSIMGMGQQIQEELLNASPNNFLSKEDKVHAVELREYNHSCIMGLLGTTADLMQWYRDVAKEYMDRNLEISWLLPDGFKVIQRLPKTKTKQVALENQTVFINYRVPTDKQDVRRNLSAYSPNVTHSMDATHLAMVVSRLPKGIPFVTIHDSYGLTAPDVARCGQQLIAEAFADLYDTFDITEAIKLDFKSKTGEELPIPVPQKGTLLTGEIREAIYAFA